MTKANIEKTVSSANSFSLPNRKVRLVPVVKNDTFMGISNHDGVFMFTGCSQSFVLPMSSRTRRLIEPLTIEEKEYLESVLKIDLDINSTSNFYMEHRIQIKKVSTDLSVLYLELDLRNPMDYLDYKILQQCPNIAKTWAERNTNPEYEWALQDLGEEFEQKVSNVELKQYAYTWLNENSNSKHKLYDVLRVYGSMLSSTASLDELKSTIYDILETPKTLRKFVELIKDKDFETKLFIDKAIRIGEILRIGTTKYALVGGDVIGNTLKETVNFIKDKSNSVLIASIADKIELNKV